MKADGWKPYVKGGDLLYLAIAMRLNCPLVSVDKGMLKYPLAIEPVAYVGVHLV